MQQVELVTVERALHGIDDHVHFVIGKLFGHLVAFTDGTPVALLEIGRPPSYIEVMDCHRTLLGVHARAEHGCRAEDDTDVTTVHGLYHRFLGFLILAFLDEANL